MIPPHVLFTKSDHMCLHPEQETSGAQASGLAALTMLGLAIRARALALGCDI